MFFRGPFIFGFKISMHAGWCYGNLPVIDEFRQPKNIGMIFCAMGNHFKKWHQRFMETIDSVGNLRYSAAIR
jgi:hypothetical protein